MSERKSNRGGYRPGAGRPRKAALTPFDYLIGVLRNVKAEPALRAQAAIALLPHYAGEPEADGLLADAPIGKKAAERVAANNPDTSTAMGALLAKRAGRS